MAHDSWSFSKIFDHEKKFWQKPCFHNAEIRKLWFNKSKAFSMSILTEKLFYPASPVSNGSRAVVTEENYPPTLTLILTLILTLSGRQFSSGGNVRSPFPICLFLTYVVCCEEINSEITSFNFSERSFDIIFRSIFNKKIVLQFLYESFISNFFFN